MPGNCIKLNDYRIIHDEIKFHFNLSSTSVMRYRP